jgi:hypothetical protein
MKKKFEKYQTTSLYSFKRFQKILEGSKKSRKSQKVLGGSIKLENEVWKCSRRFLKYIKICTKFLERKPQKVSETPKTV